jgi:hypothetical protein
MKKVILFLSLTLYSQLLFAQKEEWTKHFEKVKEVTSLDDDFYAKPDASKIPALISKYQEALDLIATVESKSSDYTDAAIYRKSYIYTNISYIYSEIDDFKKQEEYINKAFILWPYYSLISQYSCEKHIKFNDSNPLDAQYTKMIYLGAWAGHENKNHNRVFELEKMYEPVKKGVNYYNEWAIYYDMARSYELKKSKEEKAEHWVIALEKWPALDSESKKENEEGPLNNSMIKKINAMSTADNSLMLRAANALYAVEKYAEANKWFGNYAKSAGSPLLNAGWDYSESAMKEPDKTDAKYAVNIIEEHTSGFSEYEWERLQKVYEFIGDNAKVQEIKNKIAEARRKAEEERRLQAQRDEEERKRRERANRKANARENFSVAVSTNPFMYIWKDYPVALDIRIGRVISEFRVNFSNTTDKGDKYRFGQYKLSSNSNSNPYPYHYKGMEYSYTLKILAGKMETKRVGRRKQIVGGYVGFQPRYAKYNFSSEPYTFRDSTTMILETFNNISASATRYEFCILGGFLGDNLGGLFHIDYYFGVGVGYRKLDISSTDDTFNYSNYSFDDNGDRRFDPDRWNKIYVPVRFGFRIGINLL